MTDQALDDALFLHAHPGWSTRDLAEADQDTLDLLRAIDLEGAKRSRQQRAEAETRALTRRR